MVAPSENKSPRVWRVRHHQPHRPYPPRMQLRCCVPDNISRDLDAAEEKEEEGAEQKEERETRRALCINLLRVQAAPK